MAYVNVAEWKTNQVCEWLKGLDNSILPYVHSFSNHRVSGQQLLNLRPEDLEQLGVFKLGHQETILEAVEYLRNFHYEHDRENLQLLSLRLSCLTHSLFNELSQQTDSQPVSTQTLADVASIISIVKPLVCWLDRPPFSGQLEYNDKKGELLKLSLEMATCAQRDRFAEKPIEEIRTVCGQLAKLADYIVQEISDPMILQPASLDLATFKKRSGDDLGFCILPSFHGAHQIAEIKFGSAAHQCGKMEEGDEIVQVNYQTVVGWERKNVLELFRESPAEVILTLKRRPRHTKVYGQIYIKPYRLPSNKKTPYASRWHHNLPSPRPELLTIPDFTMPLPKVTAKDDSSTRPVPTIIDTVDMLDNLPMTDSDSDSEIDPSSSVRLYLAKPRNPIQRRATITGASPTTKHGIDIERFWRELKQEHSSSFQLRDKAASCAHGLNNVQANSRPQTCLGIEQRKKREKRVETKRVQFHDKNQNNRGDSEESCSFEKDLPSSTEIPNNKKVSCVDYSEVSSKVNSRVEIKNDAILGVNFKERVAITQYDSEEEEEEEQEEPFAKFRDSGEVKIVVGSVVKKINDFEKQLNKSNDKLYSSKVPNKRSINISVSSEDYHSKERDLMEKANTRERVPQQNNLVLDIPNEKFPRQDWTEDTRVDEFPRRDNRDYKMEFNQESTNLEIAKHLEEPISEPESERSDPRLDESFETIVERKLEESLDLIVEDKSSPETPRFRPQVKPRLTPPEPPPRKYFTKPSVSNLNRSLNSINKAQVPKKPSVKIKELKTKHEKSEIRSPEVYSDFVDKSSDVINELEPETLQMDFYGYSHIHDTYSRDEKLYPQAYEPSIERFSARFDSKSNSLHMDSPDGAGCSKQIPEKPKIMEKERGVVNRAMMVARSIGLSKSPGSPKSSRKKNMALTKRRNVSVKEISPGDLEGWLTYRSKGAGGAWAKAWFVLKGNFLYRFKGHESTKADCLIALSGFTASQALEVKSRKHAFKVYHTGTVFYFAADTDDSLLTWLDAVSRTTLGTDAVDRISGLFSETDESDAETRGKPVLEEEKSKEKADKDKCFGSLKKGSRKQENFKDQNLPTGASLDRKYLKFLGKSQNVPVPTAQFRSYRRVLPNSTPRKQDSPLHPSEMPVTVAGSTFYGLNASRSTTDVVQPSSSQDMADYRRTSERYTRTRPANQLQGFITLEEFMLARQEEDQRETSSPRFTPLTSDHVHIQHRTFDNLESARTLFMRDISNTNGVIYGFPKNYDESSSTSESSHGMQILSHAFERRASGRTRDSETKSSTPKTLNCMRRKKSTEDPYYDSRAESKYNLEQTTRPISPKRAQVSPEYNWSEFRASGNHLRDMEFQRRIHKNNVYSGSSGDLPSHSLSDILQVPRASVNRNGSFNLADCRREKIQEKKMSKFEKNRLKHVIQYQPPPPPSPPPPTLILNSSSEQNDMRPDFEMHLDKGEESVRSKLKNFFSNKSSQMETPKDTQKTLLRSPRLHRAFFREKSSTQPKKKRSGSQSPGDSGISQSLSSESASQSQTLSHSFSSVSSVSDWSPEGTSSSGQKVCLSDPFSSHGESHKRAPNSRNMNSPPTLPYIPPPTSPPPDYPGLEYPPVFEPGTYSFTDAPLLRSRSGKES